MSEDSDLIKCPFCNKKTASKLDAPAPADKFLLVGYNQSENKLLLDSGFSIDAYGCASCKKVWLESPTLKIVD